jgi:hypothetical protein
VAKLRGAAAVAMRAAIRAVPVPMLPAAAVMAEWAREVMLAQAGQQEWAELADPVWAQYAAMECSNRRKRVTMAIPLQMIIARPIVQQLLELVATVFFKAMKRAMME